MKNLLETLVNAARTATTSIVHVATLMMGPRFASVTFCRAKAMISKIIVTQNFDCWRDTVASFLPMS